MVCDDCRKDKPVCPRCIDKGIIHKRSVAMFQGTPKFWYCYNCDSFLEKIFSDEYYKIEEKEKINSE